MLCVGYLKIDDVRVKRPFAVHQLQVEDIRLVDAEYIGDSG